jgi:hypothetical protein
MDHHTMKISLRTLESVMSVLITHIVMKTETAHVISTGIQPLTVISIAEHAGRTVPNQLEIVTHVDAMDQLSTTVMHVSNTPIAQSMDTVLVTRTGETQITEQHVATIAVNVTTDAQTVTDQPTLTVKPA